MEGFFLLPFGPQTLMHSPSVEGRVRHGGCEVHNARTCSNTLSVPLREMTGETGLAVKDGEAKKYVSVEASRDATIFESHQGWLLLSCIKIDFGWLYVGTLY